MANIGAFFGPLVPVHLWLNMCLYVRPYRHSSGREEQLVLLEHVKTFFFHGTGTNAGLLIFVTVGLETDFLLLRNRVCVCVPARVCAGRFDMILSELSLRGLALLADFALSLSTLSFRHGWNGPRMRLRLRKKWTGTMVTKRSGSERRLLLRRNAV